MTIRKKLPKLFSPVKKKKKKKVNKIKQVKKEA